MPGVRCAISTCKNAYLNTKNIPDKHNITYHSFPKDEEVRKIWIKRCCRLKEWRPTLQQKYFICSVHFNDDDYERDLQAELLNVSKLILNI